MGNLSSSIRQWLTPPGNHFRLILLGLDASGKTTILYKMTNKFENVVTTIPTIGFNVETIHFRGTIFTSWDVSGRDKIRPLWRYYFKDTDALIWVVDSNDMDRMDQARDELGRTMDEEELKHKPLLVLCNKQDLPNAVTPNETYERLGLSGAGKQQKSIALGCTATTGEGLNEGLDWLTKALQEQDQVVEGHTETKESINHQVVDYDKKKSSHVEIIGYDPTKAGGNQTLERFAAIQRGTECPFAKSAKLWGGHPTSSWETIEANAKANVKALSEFVCKCQAENLEGFCIELNEPQAREGGPEQVGDCTRRLLTTLSRHDFLEKQNVMLVNYVGNRGWRFRFGGMDFFVTSFAPCYPSTSSRFAFGTERAFLLLQPEESFLRKNLPPDTAETHWDNPQTIRDKTRVAYRNAGRPYHIPPTTKYPAAQHIVKPLVDNGDNVVRWWNQTNNLTNNKSKERI